LSGDEEKTSRNVYLSHLLSKDETMLWNGNITGYIIENRLKILQAIMVITIAIMMIFFVWIQFLSIPGFGDSETIIMFSFIVGPIECSSVIAFILSICLYFSYSLKKNQNYFITTKRIILIRYTGGKDEIYSTTLDNVDEIIINPWKKRDRTFMNVSFNSEKIISTELNSGIFETKKVYAKHSIEFKILRDWRNMQDVLNKLVPEKIIDYSKGRKLLD